MERWSGNRRFVDQGEVVDKGMERKTCSNTEGGAENLTHLGNSSLGTSTLDFTKRNTLLQSDLPS